MKIRIYNDLYDVCDRVKEIHPDYEIYYDTAGKRYEVFAKGKLQVVCPYEKLDARLIDTFIKRESNALTKS